MTMTKFGSAYSETDPLKLAPGESVNAGSRHHKNVFDLAVDGGTSEPLKMANIGPGNVPDRFVIETGANLSAINFTIGTPADPDKYGTAVAGPNATVQVRYPLLALGVTPTDVGEEIILTPSGNLPSSGLIKTNVVTSHR
jgi:hypothetical protein